jgi:hypothetical protein
MMDDVIDRIFKVTYWVAAALLIMLGETMTRGRLLALKRSSWASRLPDSCVMALLWGLIVFAVWALVCWIAS